VCKKAGERGRDKRERKEKRGNRKRDAQIGREGKRGINAMKKEVKRGTRKKRELENKR
jgi:hypothetical protein